MQRVGLGQELQSFQKWRAACEDLGAEAGPTLTICVGSELRCSSMTSRGGKQRRAGGEQRGEFGRDSETVANGVRSRIQLDRPAEVGSAMAAAPEADVSDRPRRREAPPRASARHLVLSEPAGAGCTALEG